MALKQVSGTQPSLRFSLICEQEGMGACDEAFGARQAKQLPVQILAVAANIQTRTLKTEAEKGSMRTAAAHGLADPKRHGCSAHAGGCSAHGAYSHAAN